MRGRNKEKWWFGLLAMSGLYYLALKAHKVGNGLAGHQSGFYAAAVGLVGCSCRLAVHSGSRRVNALLVPVFMMMMWYEIGRYHLWSEHVVEFRRAESPERYHSLLEDYVPQSVDVEFLPYREVKRVSAK